MTRRRVPENLLAFCQAFGVALYSWQEDAFGRAVARHKGRFRYRLAGVSVPRGNGKSYAGAAVGLWRLLAGPPPQDIISAALDLDGAHVVLDHARSIVQSHPDLAAACEFTAGGVTVPATGSRWTVTSREHTASRGRHPSVAIYDEIGWARDDELFASLLAGQASVADPLLLVISTVGRRKSGPLWHVKALAEGGDPDTFWYHSGENWSPRITPDFLATQRCMLLPAQYAREHQNQWVDAADSFTSSGELDVAVSHGWREQHVGRPGCEYVQWWDLGTIHDPTVGAVGHAEGNLAFLDKLVTFQGSREAPVSLAAVEETIQRLAEQFPPTVAIRIESWQGMSAVQHLARLNLPVELFTPTAKAHAEEWPVLAQRLSSHTLVLYPHARLREELLGLVYEVGPQGVRVLERGGIHQDHAVCVRGVVALLAQRGQYEELRFLGAAAETPHAPRPRSLDFWQRRARRLDPGEPAEDLSRVEETVMRRGFWFPGD